MTDKILNAAREHYFASVGQMSDLPSLGSRWDEIRSRMREVIDGFRSADDAVAHGMFKFGFDHRDYMTEDSIPMLAISITLLRGHYPHFRGKIAEFEEIAGGPPGASIDFQSKDGARVRASKILYFHAFYLLTCLTFKPDIDSVCEIGGGYGNPARLWFENPIRRVKRYAIVDLPESLFFAEVFLRTVLPDVPLHYASRERPASASPGINLVPVHLSHQTDHVPFAIAVNTGSMPEMSDEWVAFWSKWLDRQSTDLFYSHNMIGHQTGTRPDAISSFAPRVEPGWAPVYVNGMHPMLRLHTDEYKLAEIIFRRGAPAHDAGRLLDLLGSTRLSYENFILGLYALCGDASRLEDFAGKASEAFGFESVELSYLRERALRRTQADRTS